MPLTSTNNSGDFLDELLTPKGKGVLSSLVGGGAGSGVVPPLAPPPEIAPPESTTPKTSTSPETVSVPDSYTQFPQTLEAASALRSSPVAGPPSPTQPQEGAEKFADEGQTTPPLNVGGQLPNLSALSAAPPGVPQKPKPGMWSRIGNAITKYLPWAGAVGAGLEAAGNPTRPPYAAEMLQRSLAEQARLRNVDIPAAQAHAQYFKNIASQYGMVPYTYNDSDGNPVTIMVQQKDLGRVGAAGISGQAGIQKTQIAKRFMSVPNVGVVDLQKGELVPGSSPQGVTINPDIAKEYNLPSQLINKTIPLQQFSALERGASFQNIAVQGAQGPALVNRNTAQVTPLGLGSPAQNPMAQARLGLEQESLGLRFGNAALKVYQPALDADMRLKQMYQQATDVTGASDQALLFNHIAMTGGQVKGLRMGEYLTEAHRTARGIPESLAVMWNKLSTGESLSPQQRQNFVHLAEQVRQTTWDRARRQAPLVGAEGEPSPDPDLPPLNTLEDTQPVPLNTPSPVQRTAPSTQHGIGTFQGGAPNTPSTPKSGSKPPSKPGNQYSVGQKVTFKNGKSATITKVYPDGTFDAN